VACKTPGGGPRGTSSPPATSTVKFQTVHELSGKILILANSLGIELRCGVMISDCCANVPLRHCDVDSVVTRIPKPMPEQEVEELLTNLANLARKGCQRLLGRDFTDDEKVNLSRGYEALEGAIRDILLGKPVALTATETDSPKDQA
jgi:hypothetical protein